MKGRFWFCLFSLYAVMDKNTSDGYNSKSISNSNKIYNFLAHSDVYFPSFPPLQSSSTVIFLLL